MAVKFRFSMTVQPLFGFVLLLGMSCSNDATDAGTEQDAAHDAGPQVSTPEPPAAPMPTNLPNLLPCPEGWHEVTSSTATNVAHCEPWVQGPEECSSGEAHFVGEPGCREIGAACPPGDFPEDLPSSGVHYVLQGATGGDGSMARPFGSIAAATASAAAGSIIAVGKGTYVESVDLQDGVTLVGACPKATVIRDPRAPPLLLEESNGVINVWGSGVSVSNITIGDSGRIGMYIPGEAAATVNGVLIDSTLLCGILQIQDSRLTASDIVVRNAKPYFGDFGRGLDIETSAEAQVTRAVFEGHRSAAVYLADDARVSLEDVYIRNTLPRSNGEDGNGLTVKGSSVEMRRSLVETSHSFGILGYSGDTHIALEHVIVRGTTGPGIDGTFGRGVQIELGVKAEINKSVIEQNRVAAILATSSSTAIRLTDVILRDTEGTVDTDQFGHGLHVQYGATATITRVLSQSNQEIGVMVSTGGRMRGEDLFIYGTRPPIGRALEIQASRVEIARMTAERNRDSAIFAALPGTDVTLSDLVVRDTEDLLSAAATGRGISIQSRSRALISRALFERNRSAGIFISSSTVTLEDIVVRDTGRSPVAPSGGRGMEVQVGSVVAGSRLLFERNSEICIASTGTGNVVNLEDVVIKDTLSICGPPACEQRIGGTAVGAYGNAYLSMTRFEINGASLCGVQVNRSSIIDLSEGVVTHTEVGACLQTEDAYDTNRLTNQVSFQDNETNLQTTSLPIPAGLESLSNGEDLR